MKILIEKIPIEIPDNFINERAKILHIDSPKEDLEDIRCTIAEYLQCLTTAELKNKNMIQEKVINHLISEMELYK